MDLKVCKECGVEKSLDDFYIMKGKYNKTTPKKTYRYGKCKQCLSKYYASRYKDPDGKLRARRYSAAWRQKNNGKRRAYHLKRSYGMTHEDYLKMVHAQNGACAICGRVTTYSLHVDHDHNTGLVRGLLCQVCNRMLGHAKDDPDLLIRAARYLESFEFCEDERP